MRSRSASGSSTWASTTWSTCSPGWRSPKGCGGGAHRGAAHKTGGGSRPAPGAEGQLMQADERDYDVELELDRDESEEEELDGANAFQALLADRRKLLTGVLVVALIVFAIYVVFPKLVGLDDAVKKLDDASLSWVIVAI